MEALWILIMLAIGGGSSAPVSVETQEFTSEGNCEAAGHSFVTMKRDGVYLSYKCVPK